MAHIKKMVMHGFKSFARRTEIIFDKGINVVVGPNGAGKSNISDALCFVLGRLSIKSMRAAKARNLIFMGSKYIKPAREASVEIIFDNKDREFAIDSDEITVRRAVRINGQSVYKINGDTKTRTEVIETLAQAGIDPYGFNIILQGEIQSIVKMHSEDRRKIIEEVAGISIYESRKEKSLKELDKTDGKLKEISTILRERTAFLNNLEKEKTQAQKYQDLKSMVKKIKASILKKRLDEKRKEIDSVIKAIEDKSSEKEKRKEKVEKLQTEANDLAERINKINKHIQQATGLEQGRLRDEITNLRAALEGLKVRKEGYENRKSEIEKRIEEMKKSIPEMETEIKGMREKSPLMAQKAKELKKKKGELAQLQDERKRLLTLKTEIASLKERLIDKQKQISRAIAESESLVKQLEDLSINLQYNNEEECFTSMNSLKKEVHEKKKSLDGLHSKELENEKKISLAESEISRSNEIKEKVGKLDMCPLCQSKMTETHVQHVFKEADHKIDAAKKTRTDALHELEVIREQRKDSMKEIDDADKKIYSCEREIITHKTIHDKKNLLKNSVDYEKLLKNEVKELEDRRNSLENKTLSLGEIEEKYESKMLEIEEISSRTEEDIDTTLLYREREIEKIKSIVERSDQDLKDIRAQIGEISKSLEEKQEELGEKEEREEELKERFQKMFDERDKLQKSIQEESVNLSNIQNEVRQIEDQVNYLKIGKAKLDSELETIEIDIGDYAGIELVQGSLNHLDERLKKIGEDLEHIGSINMRALEVYTEIKKEYDSVKDKVDTLEKEKVEIMKIIGEIDKKKYRTFNRTFRAINELFSRNFSRLSWKGATAYLEMENKENVFEGGVSIIVKMGKGKYFDVTSLSGGEQTLVALSLLFAIQEYSPYQFYILDEIDAALDKRNSERLAGLLNHYIQSGQYIIITHNDAIILNSQVLYGVSMHEGVSKVLSIKLSEEVVAMKTESNEDENADAEEETVEAQEAIEPEDDSEGDSADEGIGVGEEELMDEIVTNENNLDEDDTKTDSPTEADSM
ncbi:MAG: chromosome segregation SMC family protein [Nanoarchaeota archaeon]|nr:chromosome segregation SMC family protein [Nanoarchaeota archaeon]